MQTIHYNGVTFSVDGSTVAVDTYAGFIVRIEFPGRGDGAAIDAVLVKVHGLGAGSGYYLHAIHFDQDSGKQDYSLTEIYALCTSIIDTPQKILADLYAAAEI